MAVARARTESVNLNTADNRKISIAYLEVRLADPASPPFFNVRHHVISAVSRHPARTGLHVQALCDQPAPESELGSCAAAPCRRMDRRPALTTSTRHA